MQSAKLIGSSPLVTNYAYSCNFFNLNSIYAQSLRWKRKPIWLPTAKTKVFRVPQRPKIPEEEHKEIQRLYNNYRTYMHSIRAYFKEINEQNEVFLDHAVIEKEEELDFNRCMEINDEWNRAIAAEREIRLQKAQEERIAKALESMEFRKKEREETMKEVESKVKEMKRLVPTFITRKNIDQAIEEALADVVDHNKALNLDGTWSTENPGVTNANKKAKIQINQ